MHPGREKSMHYFSWSGGPIAKTTKTALEQVTPNYFLHPVGYAGPRSVLVRPVREMSMHYFSCSCVPVVDLIKSAPGHVMSKLCFCIR
jgi:hypothetical protein